MDVWIVESGEYEQRYIYGVFSSADKAIEAIKQTYAPPYVVSWDAVEMEEGGFTLTGQFAAVPSYSTDHVASFEGWLSEVDAR